VKIIFTGLFLLLIQLSHAQEKIETLSVSVNSITQEVTVKWKAFSDTSLIDWYVIYEWKKNLGVEGVDLSTAIFVPKTQTQYTFSYSLAVSQPVKFVVYAQDGPPVLPPLSNQYTQKNISRTIYAKAQYDSCKSDNFIAWYPYLGWGATSPYQGNIKEYQIIDANSGLILGKTQGDTVFKVENVKQNQIYQYYIKAINTADTNIYSKSNICAVNTKTKQPPAFMNAESVIYKNSSNEIYFTLDASSQMNHYTLTRSENPSGPFSKIADYPNITTSSLTAQDPDPLPNTAYYRLEALNFCDYPVLTSNLATAIVPKISYDGRTITVNWDEYLQWKDGISAYSVFHKLGNTDSVLYQTVSPGGTLISTENVSNLINKQIQGSICYNIVTHSSLPGLFTSVSKPVCIDLSSEAFIPNAFTPDGNGQNDWFTASFTFLPVKFKMLIYDRYGYKIFETSDLKGWNGILGNGKNAIEGTYIYFINFYTNDGKKIEKKGSFSIIYP
jgi:gliding motility-associated-like protein